VNVRLGTNDEKRDLESFADERRLASSRLQSPHEQQSEAFWIIVLDSIFPNDILLSVGQLELVKSSDDRCKLKGDMTDAKGY
jgi:hypothetical protein